MDPLPTSRLTDLLQRRVAARNDLNIDLLARLNDLRSRVAAESRYIVALFPEYTPHDEQYHTASLFKIADILIGEAQLERLNSTELFILACAIYAHDWGMAVSEAEKVSIVNGSPPANDALFKILPNEPAQFARFLQEQGVESQGEKDDSLDAARWREYVRVTHAFRSGERVRKMLAPVDNGLAEAIARVCESHWLNIEDLDDYQSYPPNYAVLREPVNLRALAIYLRLVDLFDLAGERTPYVIWKYVAPRDPRSKLEWAKHRAINSVTAQQHQDGRVLHIDGQTDDVEVYAAIKDLEALCERELRGCMHLLARTNDPRHALDVFHSEWRITAKGFKPIAIRFDFAREKMFEILAEEIYGGDSYVFLRELLQNSIDAIRMRREVLNRNGIPADALGTIRVTVSKDTSGNTVIHWSDDGIGMDEYIVRNYLALAGRSYYQSDDFKKHNLKLDPIARFGIGLLSCFAVAERIHINTRREPYLGGQNEALSIDIPAFDRYFRIEASTDGKMQVGTTITVFVDPRKLPSDESSQPIELNVTDYLERVAGFVDFPIVVNESGTCTVITSPLSTNKKIPAGTDEKCRLMSLPLTYPFAAVCVDDDTPAGKPAVEEESFDLEQDLGMCGFTGRLSFLTPASDVGDVTKGSIGEGAAFTAMDESGNNSTTHYPLRVHDEVTDYFGPSLFDAISEMKVPEDDLPHTVLRFFRSPSRSSWFSPFYRVYREGVLVSLVSPPLSFQNWSQSKLPVPYITVNISKSVAPRVDLARTRIMGPDQSWDAPIAKAFVSYLSEKRLPGLLALAPADRLRELARWSVAYRLSADTLWELVPHERWPVAFLDKGQQMVVREWGDIKNLAMGLLDERIELNIRRIINALHGRVSDFPPLPDEYFPVLLYHSNEPNESQALVSAAAFTLSYKPFKEHHALAELNAFQVNLSAFAPPYANSEDLANAHIIQKVLHPKRSLKTEADVFEILNKDQTSAADLDPEQLVLLSQSIKSWPAVARFSDNIAHLFVFNHILNSRHKLTPLFLKLFSYLEIQRRQNPGQSDSYATIQLLVNNLDLNYWSNNPEEFNRFLPEIRKAAMAAGFPIEDWPTLQLSKEDLPVTGYFYKI